MVVEKAREMFPHAELSLRKETGGERLYIWQKGRQVSMKVRWGDRGISEKAFDLELKRAKALIGDEVGTYA